MVPPAADGVLFDQVSGTSSRELGVPRYTQVVWVRSAVFTTIAVDIRQPHEGVKMVPIGKHAFRSSLQVIVGPVLIFSVLMSCHSNQPAGNVQGNDDMLSQRINALQHDPLGPIDLGSAIAVPTDNTEYIIGQKARAVPLLIEALKNDQKPVQVGYAAYCLRRIGSDKGKEVAAAAYDKLSKRGEEIRIEERIARDELENYLDFLKKQNR